MNAQEFRSSKRLCPTDRLLGPEVQLPPAGCRESSRGPFNLSGINPKQDLISLKRIELNSFCQTRRNVGTHEAVEHELHIQLPHLIRAVENRYTHLKGIAFRDDIWRNGRNSVSLVDWIEACPIPNLFFDVAASTTMRMQ